MQAGTASVGDGIGAGEIIHHWPYWANTASRVGIARSFFCCWSELSELLAVCPSQARSPRYFPSPIGRGAGGEGSRSWGSRLVIDDQTTWFAAGVPDTPVGTDLHTLSVCGLGGETSRGNATGGAATVAEDCTSESESETAAESGVVTPPEAATFAVGVNNTKLEEARLVELGTAVVVLVSPDVVVDTALDTLVVSVAPPLDGLNTTVPPAPTVKAVQLGRAPLLATINVPPLTVVPPV